MTMEASSSVPLHCGAHELDSEDVDDDDDDDHDHDDDDDHGFVWKYGNHINQ